MKKLVLLLLIVLIGNYSVSDVRAIVDPRTAANNKFGIHVVNEADLEKAAELVNSSGGEWGYVTVVLQQDDRVRDKWQKIFDRMRELKLIPIVRLATRFENGAWEVPKIEQARSWADFLISLNWVVKNKYVILFNEPNHAKEWGGVIRPDEYARVARIYLSQLKEFDDDFFVLPAGLDLAASNTKTTMGAVNFWQGVYREDAELLAEFDGLTSHSYPNPGFVGRVFDVGQRSVRGYEWELMNLHKYGVDLNIPVFITETGWVHQEGKNFDRNKLSTIQVADNFKLAFERVWNSDQIVAVTPFILNYQDEPFDHFSWTPYKSEGEVHPQFEAVKNLPKIKGEPVQIASGSLISNYFPGNLMVNSEYQVAIRFLNSGQAIWSPEETRVRIESDGGITVTADDVQITPPGHTAKVWLRIGTPEYETTGRVAIWLEHKQYLISPQVSYVLDVQQDSFLLQIRLWMEKIMHQGELLVMLWRGYWQMARFWV